MLSDEKTYKKLKRDPAPALERRMNALLLNLNRKGAIPQKLYERLRSSAGQNPLLYGLPKIHKPNVPLRPIVSFVQSPTYQLSKHISDLLSPLVGLSPSAVRNSKEFARFIASQTLEDDEVLVSFDVVSLFTNVPTDLAIEVARKRLENDETLEERTCLDVDDIIRLLKMCLDATYLTFRNTHYQQTFGTAMGSPVSVTVANLVMEEVESKALSTFTPALRFWKRYVDDTCTAIPSRLVTSFHDHLNGVNEHIQFTLEMEDNNSLPFLDVRLHHQPDGSILTSVYRKPTHTDRYLDFSSHHPLEHKRSVVTTLFSRANSLTSTMLQRMDEESHLSRKLKTNGYPQRFIRKQQGDKRTSKPDEPRKEPKASITLPYVQGLSEPIRRMLEEADIRVRFKPNTTLRKLLIKPKDPLPVERRTGIVYQIPCSDCSQTYVGQSGRTIVDRIKEHQRAVKKMETPTLQRLQSMLGNTSIEWTGQQQKYWTTASNAFQDAC